jgi:hypothetical protein
MRIKSDEWRPVRWLPFLWTRFSWAELSTSHPSTPVVFHAWHDWHLGKPKARQPARSA